VAGRSSPDLRSLENAKPIGGYGQENAKCDFPCDSNEWIKTSATVDDNGDVTAFGECADEEASCNDNDGFCSASSDSTTSYADSTGQCEGGGDGGTYTDFSIYCWTESGGTASTASAFSPDEQPDAFPALPVQDTYAQIVGVDGNVEGYVCTPSGCSPAIVECN
jgi:hypothetical protein